MNSSAPKRIGKFLIIRELGRGTSGVVYLAHDGSGNRHVAVKVYHADTGMSEAEAKLHRKLFFNEAHLAGKLAHPNILSIHAAAEADGVQYVVMTYLDKYQPLNAYCRSEKLLPISQVIQIFFVMVKALDYAHRNGVIHLDIKPANVMMNDKGEIMIVDFGIARHARTQATQVMGIGTPRYMSPEQIREEDVTNQSDIFSLGSVLYELLTGTHAFSGKSLAALTHQILDTDPPPVNKLRPDIPEPLSDIVMRCLQKPLQARYKKCVDIASDLIKVYGSLGTRSVELVEQERHNLVSELPFFGDFTQAEIWEIVRAARWQTYTDKQPVVSEGELDERFFVIVSGEVTVHKGGKLLDCLKAGDCFGEMGYAGKTRRSATVLAQGDVRLLCINATLMERVSNDCQLRFYRVFTRTLIERLSRANEKLLGA